MKAFRLLAASAASGLLVAALAACAPPEKGGQGDQTRSGVTVSEATSATDFGGMDALVEAAKKEGELNVLALPLDWANYGNIIKGHCHVSERWRPGRIGRGEDRNGVIQGPPLPGRDHRPLRVAVLSVLAELS